MKDIIKIEPKQLLEAVDKMENSVVTTLGPFGKTTVINGNYPIVTKDGITIVQHLESPNPIDNMVFRIVGEAAKAVSTYVGDGTTTATGIACSIIRYCIISKFWPLSYENKTILREYAKEIITEINKKATTVTFENQYDKLQSVAIISTNGDRELATIALEAVEYTGIDGTVLLGYNRAMDSIIDKIAGYRLNKGIASPAFAQDKVSYQVTQEKPIVIVGTKAIDSMEDILPILQDASQKTRPLAIFCSAIHPNIIQTLARNVSDGRLDLCVYDIPGTGTTQADYAQDIAQFAGVVPVLDDVPMTYIEAYNIPAQNTIDKIIANPVMCTFITKDNTLAEKRAKDLKQLASTLEDKTLADEYTRRAAALLGKIASVKLGSSTMIARQERLDRLDDAVHALQSAIRKGIIPGGLTIPRQYIDDNKIDEEKENILKTIIMNILFSNKDKAKESDIRLSLNYAITELYFAIHQNNSITPEDMIEQNIYDPVECCTLAIDAGVNAAINLLSSMACITEVKNA